MMGQFLTTFVGQPVSPSRLKFAATRISGIKKRKLWGRPRVKWKVPGLEPGGGHIRGKVRDTALDSVR